ncbi:MAG: hypothetical protein IJC80_06885 [Clostridia bacterium]|nr:hypothetical protein [Clostridia bacterium]
MRKILLIIAFIIFANPLASNVDVLPDLFGYILIMVMLSKHTYYDAQAKSAYKCTRNMAIVSAFKLASVYISTMVVDDTISLVFSFVFFTVELVFGIPFLLKLFEYCSQRALKSENMKAIKIVDGVKIATVVLFGVRLLLATAPDFILLTAHDPLSLYDSDLSHFRPVLIVLSVLISSIITLAWLPLESYFFAVTFTKREASLASEELSEKLTNKRLQFNLSLQGKMLPVLAVLSLFVFELKIDNIDIFFNTALIFGFIAIYVFLLIKKYVRFDKLLYPLIGVTAVQFIFNIIVKMKTRAFFEKYTLSSVFEVSQAETDYYSIIPFSAVSWLLFVGAFVLSMLLLLRSAKNTLNDHIEVCLPYADREYTVGEFKKRAKLLFILPTVACSLVAVISPVVLALMPRIDELTKVTIFGTVINLPLFPSLVPLQLILTLGFVALFIYSLVVINDQVYKKLYYKISLD